MLPFAPAARPKGQTTLGDKALGGAEVVVFQANVLMRRFSGNTNQDGGGQTFAREGHGGFLKRAHGPAHNNN